MEILEKKIIRIKPIVRTRPFFGKGHDGEFLYTGCKRTYGLPYSSSRRSYFNPFQGKDTKEKKEEQTLFEKELNQKEGALSLYDIKSKFWGKFMFTLDKETLELDLNNPNHALIYRIMKVHPKFANNDDQKDVPECEYMIVDEAVEEKNLSARAEIKDKAMDFMYKLKKSKKAMYNTLRLLSKKPDINASMDWFKTELYKILDQSGTTPGVIGIKQFLEVMEDPTAETKVFVLDLVDKAELVQTAEGYRVADSREFIGRDLQSVYDHFGQKTPEISEQVQILKQRLK